MNCLPSQPGAALVAQDEHGGGRFAELTVAYRNTGEVRLGRIGSSVLRCFTSDAFYDDALLAHVGAQFPALREAVAIVDYQPPAGSAASGIATSIRMVGSAAAVLARVRERRSRPVLLHAPPGERSRTWETNRAQDARGLPYGAEQ